MEEMRPSPDRAATLPDAGDWRISPLDPFPAAAESMTPQRIQRIIWGFLLLGIAVRAVRFLLCFPLWPDEAYLAHNYLDRGYFDLLKPLDFIQIAPILYLWVQKTFVNLFGFSEYSLRLYSLLCGVASLFVFRYLAGRLLRGTALVLAFAVFAVAYPLVRYSGEAKPYGGDMLVAHDPRDLGGPVARAAGQIAVVVGVDLGHAPGHAAVLPGGVHGRGNLSGHGDRIASASRLAMAIVAAMGRRLCGPGRRRGRALRALRPRTDGGLGPCPAEGVRSDLPPAAEFAGRTGRLPAGQPHGRRDRLSDRRQVGGQPADGPLLPGRLDPAAAIAAILPRRVVRLALGA